MSGLRTVKFTGGQRYMQSCMNRASTALLKKLLKKNWPGYIDEIWVIEYYYADRKDRREPKGGDPPEGFFVGLLLPQIGDLNGCKWEAIPKSKITLHIGFQQRKIVKN